MSSKILIALLVVALVLGTFAVLVSAAQSPADQAPSPKAPIWSAQDGHPFVPFLEGTQLNCGCEIGGNCDE